VLRVGLGTGFLLAVLTYSSDHRLAHDATLVGFAMRVLVSVAITIPVAFVLSRATTREEGSSPNASASCAPVANVADSPRPPLGGGWMRKSDVRSVCEATGELALGERMTVLRNIGWGMRWGARLALIFCGWILVLMLFERSLTLHLRHGHAGPGLGVIVLYMIGGPFAGAIVGLLRPLLRWRLGAMATGTLAAVLLFLGVRILLFGFAPWRTEDTILVIAGSLMLGPLTALLIGELDEEIDAAERARKRPRH
jgi:hypothetical protein